MSIDAENLTIRIPVPSCMMRYLAFIAYNLMYVLYMEGFVPQSYYLVMLAAFCMMNAFTIYARGQSTFSATRELKLGFGYTLVFLLVSVFIQTIHQDFGSYLYADLFRITLPVVNAFLFVNSVKEDERDMFFTILFLRFILHFIIANYGSLSIASLLSISWLNSFSPMESSLAHDFIMLEMFYLYKGNKRRAFVSMVFCMLSMKRLSFLLAPVLMIFADRVPKGKEVAKPFLIALKAAAIISPFIMMGVYSEGFLSWLSGLTGINANLLMSGRAAIYNTLQNSMDYYNGYGSVNNFLSGYVMTQYGTTWNAVLHNDFLRIYLETTIVGVVVLANNLVELGKKEYWHYIMIAYLILVAITSHILNYFSVWVTFYMIIMCTGGLKENTADKTHTPLRITLH